jgi:hypothetical protein
LAGIPRPEDRLPPSKSVILPAEADVDAGHADGQREPLLTVASLDAATRFNS